MTATVLQPAARLSLLARARLETLLQASQAFNSTIDLDALLPRLLEKTLAVTESEAGALWIVEGDAVRCAHAAGPAVARLAGRSLPTNHGVIQEALQARAAVVVQDALHDARFQVYRDDTGFRTRSAVTIPLVAGDVALGAIELVNDVGGKELFDEADVAFLEALADDAAAALRNARLYDAERRARDLKALLEVSHEITSTFDIDRVLISVVNLAGRAVRFDRCVLAVWSKDQLRVRAISGAEKIDARSAGVKQLESFLTWTAQERESLEVPDIDSEEKNAAVIRTLFREYVAAESVRALLVLPIRDAEGELGRLLFEFKSPVVLEGWMREAAQLLANEAALAIRNAQLYADVPFISFLEPLAQKRRRLLALPRPTLLKYGVVAVLLLSLFVFVPIPVRVTARDAQIFAAAQRPARAGASGIITSVLVRDGDQVTANQPIAQLRNEELLLRLTTVEGDLRAAERRGLAAEARGDAADAAAARVRASQLRAALELLQQERAALTVRAPVTGVVLTPRLEELVGSYREAGEAIVWIGAAEWAEVRLRIAHQDIGAVRTGDRVRVRVPARPEIRYEGNVQAIAPLAEHVDAQPLYTVRALLDNRAGVLRAGMAARGRVYTRARPLAYVLLRRPWRWIRIHLWY